MIINLPTQESLNNVALKIYYRAWDDLLIVFSEFYLMFSESKTIAGAREMYSTEWVDYVDNTQSDLQSVCSLLQQSMELALKARICDISPYLLLLNNGMKLSTTSKMVDFSVLRTLDATDLPGAVNTLTNEPLPDDFIERYTKLRSLRNRITHLGEAGVKLDPDEMVRLALSLYIDIWPNRQWLPDRLDFASQTRHAWFYDGKYTSTHMEVLQEWNFCIQIFTKGEFKSLIGHPKTERRFRCHHCVYEGDTRYAGFDDLDIGTAYLNKAKCSVTCVLCKGTFQVEQKKCPNCKGTIIGSADDDFKGYCHTCGTDILDEELYN